MEGFMVTEDGDRIPLAEIINKTPQKRRPFCGITPVKDCNYESNMDKPFKVSVEGNIGVGKSTLIQYFEGSSGVETYPVSTRLFIFV